MNASTPSTPAQERAVKEQVVLVLQGGGALGAYQSYVYQALHEAGLEPDWVSMPPKHVGDITHDVHREYEGR